MFPESRDKNIGRPDTGNKNDATNKARSMSLISF